MTSKEKPQNTRPTPPGSVEAQRRILQHHIESAKHQARWIATLMLLAAAAATTIHLLGYAQLIATGISLALLSPVIAQMFRFRTIYRVECRMAGNSRTAALTGNLPAVLACTFSSTATMNILLNYSTPALVAALAAAIGMIFINAISGNAWPSAENYQFEAPAPAPDGNNDPGPEKP